MPTSYMNQGKDITTALLRKLAQAEANLLGWGTGAGSTLPADTTLFTEAAEARVAGTSSQQTQTVANDTYQVIGTLTNDQGGAAKTITNAGLCDTAKAAAAAIPGATKWLVKGDFTGIALNTNDSIQFTVRLTFS